MKKPDSKATARSKSKRAHDPAKIIEPARAAIERIVSEVWDLAEVSLEEVKSSQVHIRELKDAGFTITGMGTAGVPTAFVAEWTQGKGGPKIGFLPEYDALPGLGNAAVPKQQPREDGVTSGHGCGHNMIGAVLTGAAIAAKHAMEAQNIPGTLRVYGAAAEETEGAKVYMARAGLFDDLDACLHWHPAPISAVMNVSLAATNMMTIEFFGRTAHAGNEPWKGRSALDALDLTSHAMNMMREHVEPTARIHWIYEAAGDAPNVVPDYTCIKLTVRDADRSHVAASTTWIKQIAEGAALATQTQAKVNVYFGLHDLLPNTPLAQRMQAHLERVGAPSWTEEEQAFAKACQKEMGLAEKGLSSSVNPLLPEPKMGGSSDVAEASWITPTMGITMPTWPLGISAHTWPVTACGGMSIGQKGTLAAAKVLTLTALDLLTDAELRVAARADLDRRKGDYKYKSPLPPKQKHPLGLKLSSDGSVEALADLSKSKAGKPTRLSRAGLSKQSPMESV
jgi:aminobenzoyl-glutamate utilization protein B